MPLESVLTQWGWKLVGELDELDDIAGQVAKPTAEGVVYSDIEPLSAETLALLEGQGSISVEEWNALAAIQNPQAYVQGQILADARAATPQEQAVVVSVSGAQGTNSDILLLGGLSLLALGWTRRREYVRRSARG
jgi:hypothetical protein